eukprot:scaffold12565_cov121-Isochrysis_galbana.AAC.3
MIPLPWRERKRGIQFPQHESKHTSQAHGDEARKAQGGGKRSLHLVFRGRWISAWGPSHTPIHTPFGGVRYLESTYRQRGANKLGPTRQLILPSHSLYFTLHRDPRIRHSSERSRAAGTEAARSIDLF